MKRIIMIAIIIAMVFMIFPAAVAANAQLDIDISMAYGASIRLNAQKGMRFYTEITDTTAQQIDQLIEEGATIKIGTLILPEDMLDGELTLETEKASDVVYVEGSEAFGYFVEDGQNFIVGSIVGISEKNVTRNFVGRGYIQVTQNGETSVYYADHYESSIANNSRSIAEVAYRYAHDEEKSDAALALYNDNKKLVDSWAVHCITQQSEIAAAIKAAGTCILLNDFSVDSTLGNTIVLNDIIFDMRGHTITWGSGGYFAFTVYNGTMTVTGDGAMTTTSTRYLFTVGYNGHLVIKNGTYTTDAGKANWIYQPGYYTKNSTEIYGGTFINTGSLDYALQVENYLWDLEADTPYRTTTKNTVLITIYGGTFQNTYDPSNGDDVLKGTFVADGYESVSIGENTYTIQKAE